MIAVPERLQSLLGVIVSVLRPRERVRPSDWAAANVRLGDKYSARPGPFDPDRKPWVRKVLDLWWEEPGKRGMICKKPSQVFFSTCVAIISLYRAEFNPAPQLYVTDQIPNAKDFVDRNWGNIVDHSDNLRHFREPPRKLSGKKEKVSEITRHFPGGVIDFVWASSESGAISHARQDVYCDEFQRSCEEFPAKSGDLLQTLLKRQVTYDEAGRSLCVVGGHPRFENEDVDKEMRNRSDCREWSFECPHCAEVIFPRFAHVKISGQFIEQVEGKALLNMDAATGSYHCPHCSSTITDAERARAVWPRDKGGTGDFRSTLAPEVARAREFIGLTINRLCDPDLPVVSFVRDYLACPDHKSKQSLYNKGFGECYKRLDGVVSMDAVKDCLVRLPELPAGPLGVQYFACGVDVQKGLPSLYLTSMGYAGSGHAYAVDKRILHGWAALFEYLRAFEFKVGGKKMGLKGMGIDAGWKTGEVLGECRRSVYSAATGERILLLPVQFQNYVKEDVPYVQVPYDKCLDPDRPELGPIERYHLCRDYWVERLMRRWIDKRITVVCEPPADMLEHVLANVQVPKRQLHGMEPTHLVWEKGKDKRDDWLFTDILSEVFAAIKLKLDRIHEAAAPAGPPPSGTPIPPTRGYIDDVRQSFRRWSPGG